MTKVKFCSICLCWDDTFYEVSVCAYLGRGPAGNSLHVWTIDSLFFREEQPQIDKDYCPPQI